MKKKIKDIPSLKYDENLGQKYDLREEEKYAEFLGSVEDEIRSLARTKYKGWGGWNALMFALEAVTKQKENKTYLKTIKMKYVRAGEIEEAVFNETDLPE